MRPERIPTALETIQRNAFAQARLVDDLLDVSRIVFGKLDLCMETTVIAPIVRAAVDGVRPAADARKVTLTCVAEGDDVVLADAARLQQVIGNLLVNGVKFNQAGGHVEVRLARTEDAFEITVTDTGRGIAPELLPQIFDRFRQADRGDRASVEGTRPRTRRRRTAGSATRRHDHGCKPWRGRGSEVHDDAAGTLLMRALARGSLPARRRWTNVPACGA